jgi:hypothetical protein
VADTSIVNLDPSRSDAVRYELGAGNWRPPHGRPWIPDLANPGATIRLADDQVIDVLILGDGYQSRAAFESELKDWVTDFYRVDVYNRFAGAFRVRAFFRKSSHFCSDKRESFYRVPIGTGSTDAGEVATDKWWEAEGTHNTVFRRRLFESLDEFHVNPRTYPRDLFVGNESDDADGRVIHNQLAGMHSNLVVAMLVCRSAKVTNASGRTRAISERAFNPDNPPSRTVNVAFGSHALHEFGHAFAYLEDEYINTRRSRAERKNPAQGSVFTLSNLSFGNQLSQVPWLHLSPWGRRWRQGAGDPPSPIVGWLWRGGEKDICVWHSEYHCLMNGKHVNYAYSTGEKMTPDDVDLRFRRPPRYCLWCQEIVTLRILEKTGQLAAGDDPEDINARGRRWYRHWVNRWRDRYWAFFDVDQQIDDRELLYANPSSEPGTFYAELHSTDGSYKRLDKSDLYQPFAATPGADGDPPADDEDAILAMFSA